MTTNASQHDPDSVFFLGLPPLCATVALEAFGRCVQQDTEIGEAWANIGAIHMRQRAYTHALSALKVGGTVAVQRGGPFTHP